MNRMLTWVFLFIACSMQALAQPATNIATGIVRNDKDEPVEGVTILMDNASNGFRGATTTNSKGIFSIGKVPAGNNYRFIISAVGYTSDTLSGYEMKENGRISLGVILQNKKTALDEVVVIGYGSVRKKDLSAAVSEVPDMDQIKERPVVDVPNMIQGKVPGVTVISDGGHPEKTPVITIRGKGSQGPENPLFVVDGVPNAPYNPADVVSVTILKDAASAAIYGAFSGSSGVILITTRQAQATQGKPRIEYSAFAGAKTAWRLPQSLRADKTAEVANLAYTNAGLTPLDGWNPAKNPYDMVTRTDWVHSIFRTGLVQRHNIVINSGTEKFSTLFEGRYEENQGILLNTYNKNISGRFNALYQFSSKVKFKQDVFINNNDNRGTLTESGYDGTILSAIYMPRSATAYYPDGTFGGTVPRDSLTYAGIHGDAVNPVATLLRNKPYNKSTDMQSISELKISNIITGLSFLTRFSYRQGNTLFKNFIPKRTEPGKPNNNNELDYETHKTHSWIWENTINYNRNFGRHSIGAMASTTAQEVADMGFKASAKTFDNEADWAQFFVNAGDFTSINPDDWDKKDRNMSYVGRLSYSWADRYFLTGSYRYDIAGRLAPGHRGKGLPGATAAWKISSEPFFDVPMVDLLKIRASWGRIGNLGSINYYYGYPTLTSDYTYQVGDAAPHTRAFYMAQATNPNLTWETSEQKDLGLDISLFKERFLFTADYFNKLTYDLIHQLPNWPGTMGFAPPFINQGKIRNTGFEFTASWKGNYGKLAYEISGNIATLKNRVEYINGQPDGYWAHDDSWRSGSILPYRSTVGQPYYSYWLIKSAGIFQTDKEAQDYVGPNGTPIQPNAKAGDLKFIDQNHDGKISDSDRVYMGNAFPKFTYGFTLNLRWQRFDLSMFLQGVGGLKLFHAFKESTLNGSEQGYNRWDKILSAWSPSNPHSNIPIISASDHNNNFSTASDWYLENGDYLRVKSLVIGYNFPQLLQHCNLRVYVSGDNLLTFTKYSGMDPEVGGIGLDGGQFPVSRVYAAGVKLTF
ncbi:MAG: SusC/RagA family TonB-linked outer membrane protein [Chitinophagaceae bacterium]|nr:SusC/RagA family TonB-linked outer membrane protein [Chitinophagaceae bacterium]